MSSRQKTHLNMRQLNKLESIIYLAGGIIMVVGAGLYAFLMIQPFACWLMLVGAIAFVLVQARQRYLGTQLVVRRLRRIMTLAGWGFILAGLFMVEDVYGIVRPFAVNSIGGYTTYVNIVYHNWVVILLIATVIEFYTIHRIDHIIKKEQQSET